MPIHFTKEDEAAARVRIRANIWGTIGWGALLVGAIALFRYYPPDQMANDARALWRDVADLVTRWLESPNV